MIFFLISAKVQYIQNLTVAFGLIHVTDGTRFSF